GHWTGDHGHDVRGDRPLVQRLDAEPDRGRGLDIRGALLDGGPDALALLLRGPPASRVGRGDTVPGGLRSGSSVRTGPARPADDRPASFGMCLCPLRHREDPRDRAPPMTSANASNMG